MARELVSLWTHRRALASLVRHDLRKTYAGTAGGLVWAVLTPLLPIAIFSAIFSWGIRLPLGNAPYAFGFASAYVAWTFLSSSLTASAGALLDHRYLIKRVRFPVEIIPANALFVHALPHAILVALTAIACAIGGYGGTAILSIAYFFGCLVAFAMSAGLLLSSVSVIVRDVRQMLPSVLQIVFWLTPIAWSSDRVPEAARMALAFNPASYIVSGYRHALMPATFPAPAAFETAAFWLVTASTMLVAIACFRRLRLHFWECV
jgi:teichoic acid transport system permease protein